MSAEVARTKGCADSRRERNAPVSGCPPGKSAGSSRKKFRSSWALEELCGQPTCLGAGSAHLALPLYPQETDAMLHCRRR